MKTNFDLDKSYRVECFDSKNNPIFTIPRCRLYETDDVILVLIPPNAYREINQFEVDSESRVIKTPNRIIKYEEI